MTPFDLQDECGPTGWNEEETLDVEAVHVMAPGANIHYIGAMDCDTGIDDAVNYVLQNHTANIVSNSYGFAARTASVTRWRLEHSMFLPGRSSRASASTSPAATTATTSSTACRTQSRTIPASDPFVTAVGGTSPRRHVLERVPVRDLVGRRHRLGQLRDDPVRLRRAAARFLHLRRWRRRERAVHRAALPDAGGAEDAWPR